MKFLASHVAILAEHCPLTDLYFEPCGFYCVLLSLDQGPEDGPLTSLSWVHITDILECAFGLLYPSSMKVEGGRVCSI